MREKQKVTAGRAAKTEVFATADDWYRTLFEHTGTAIVVLDGNISIVSANSEFKRAMRSRRPEIRCPD